MKLKNIYQEIVKKGIEADIRSKAQITQFLKGKAKEHETLISKEKEFFDKESLSNPFSDTRILSGDPGSNIRSMIVGIDVDGS